MSPSRKALTYPYEDKHKVLAWQYNTFNRIIKDKKHQKSMGSNGVLIHCFLAVFGVFCFL